MKRTYKRQAALEAAWKYFCQTGNWKPWAMAFKALYGHMPVYIPQH